MSMTAAAWESQPLACEISQRSIMGNGGHFVIDDLDIECPGLDQLEIDRRFLSAVNVKG